MGLTTTLDDERLDALLVEVVNELGQWALMGQHHTFGIGAVPMANRQLWMLSDVSGMSHKDSILLSTQLVREHLCLFITDFQGLTVVVNKAISCLCPLEDDVRPMLLMQA